MFNTEFHLIINSVVSVASQGVQAVEPSAGFLARFIENPEETGLMVALLAAFLGGLVSFFSPCVLPLLPIYMSFVSGMSLEQMTNKEEQGKTFGKVFFNTLIFVCGFSIIFILAGLGASAIGLFIKNYSSQISIVAGLVIVTLALHSMGLIQIKLLYYEKRVQVKERRFGPLSSFLFGSAFAFGWTPCIGPILAMILLLASQQGSTAKGMLLLGVYSAGLAIPFLITAIFLNKLLSTFKKVNRYFDIVEVVTGAVLLIAATWLIFGQLTHVVPSIYPILAVTGAMTLLIIFRKKMPLKLFKAGAGIVVAAIVVAGVGLYFFAQSPEKSSSSIPGVNNIGADRENDPLSIKFDDFSGNVVTLEKYRGKPILLNFFASWCAPCKKEIPELIKIHQTIAKDKFYIISVNCDEEIEEGVKITKAMNIPYPVVHGKVNDLQLLGARTALPTNIILNAKGRKVQGYTGFPKAIIIRELEKLVKTDKPGDLSKAIKESKEEKASQSGFGLGEKTVVDPE